MFVDYSGLTMKITDPETGEITRAQIFVAALGALAAVFVYAIANQKQSSFILSHTLAFHHYTHKKPSTQKVLKGVLINL